VKPAPFAYARARSLDHAVELLGSVEGARVLAGGQSLLATLNMRLDAPKLLVDINRIPDLDRISEEDGWLRIGALVRHAEAMRSPLVARQAPLLALALPHIAHPAIRNRSTLCGSIAFADPAAELPACLVALGGEVEIYGPAGRRIVKAGDFFRGLFETALEANDIIAAIRLPRLPASARQGFAELARRHGDYALVGLAASAQDETLSNLRLVYFSVGPTPVRARGAEAALAQGPRDGSNVDSAVAALASDLHPDDDIHASAKVKMHLAGVLLRRVLRQMLDRSS
jgi:carbon-monoxide dehydrogenase medium subunit